MSVDIHGRIHGIMSHPLGDNQRLYPLDERYDIPLYDVTDPEDPTEKHIAVGFDYSLLDDFLNTWKKNKEDLADRKITIEGYFKWKINWPHVEN